MTQPIQDVLSAMTLTWDDGDAAGYARLFTLQARGYASQSS